MRMRINFVALVWGAILPFFVAGAAEQVTVWSYGFEKPLKSIGWGGNSFDAGPGSFSIVTEGDVGSVRAHEGKSYARLYKERGPGGTQLQGNCSIANCKRVEISFMYRGSAGDVTYKIGKIVNKYGEFRPFVDVAGKSAYERVEFKKSTEWTKISRTIVIPPSFTSEETTLNFNFKAWGGNTPVEILIDDIRVTAVEPPVKVERPSKPVVIAKPNLEPIDGYGMIEKGIDFEAKDGLLYREGKPYFWVGSGCEIGGGQSSPLGLWLAKLQNLSFIGLHAGSGCAASFNAKEKDGALHIGAQSNLGFIPWRREANRLGFLTQISMGMCDFKGAYLQKFAKENKELNEYVYDIGHYHHIDPGHDKGLDLLKLYRAESLRHTKHGGAFISELYREPGPEPYNTRVVEQFKKYAKLKYVDIERANKIWRTSFKSWDDVTPIHLDTKNLMSPNFSKMLALRAHTRTNHREMYLDWFDFIEGDCANNVKRETDFVRANFPNAPVSIDVRGHRGYTDGYASFLPEAVDKYVDLFFIHYGNNAYNYNGAPSDRKTLHSSTVYQLFAYNYFKTNTTHPLWDSENIISKTSLPGSNFEAMKANDIGRLHDEPWQFKLDPKKEGLDGKWFDPKFDDSSWGKMSVPGCWDETKEYSGKGGWAWYRKTFIADRAPNRLDYEDGSHKFYIYGRGVAQKGTVWLNGYKIGEVTGWDTPYRFDVGAYLNYGKENQITFLVDGENAYKNGLRSYCHILAHDRINTSEPFGEKQYRSMIWTCMMRGSSAVSIWNWSGDYLRPYMADIVQEVNCVAPFVLPAVRKNTSKVGFLYSYLNGLALPARSQEDYAELLDWSNAVEMSWGRPDVYGEEKFLTVRPEKTPVVLVPYVETVKTKTYDTALKYAKDGGTVILTPGSFKRTFEYHEESGLMKTLGISGMNGKDVVEAPHGKGKFVFVKENLPIDDMIRILKPYLPKGDVEVASATKGEFPYMERAFAGSEDRKLLYLHNWGGLDHDLTVTIPDGYGDWRMTQITGGEFKRIGKNTFTVRVASQAPAAVLLDSPQVTEKVSPKISPEHRALIDRLMALNKSGDGTKPKVLFCKSKKPDATPSGRELFPYVLQLLETFGCETHESDPNDWTADYLRQFKMVCLTEGNSSTLRMGRAKDQAFSAMMREYVKEGGSLFVAAYAAGTVNCYGFSVCSKGNVFGVTHRWSGTAFDKAHAGMGDPQQILTDDVMSSPLTEGVKNVQLYALVPMSINKASEMKPLVKIPSTAESGAGMPAMAYGEVGKGRVFFSIDAMAFQPGRISLADNANLLVNTLGWLLRKDVTEKTRSDFKNNLWLEKFVME